MGYGSSLSFPRSKLHYLLAHKVKPKGRSLSHPRLKLHYLQAQNKPKTGRIILIYASSVILSEFIENLSVELTLF